MCNSAGWSDSDRKGILNVHNTLRSKIAKGTYVAKKDRKPSATNMLQMVRQRNASLLCFRYMIAAWNHLLRVGPTPVPLDTQAKQVKEKISIGAGPQHL